MDIVEKYDLFIFDCDGTLVDSMPMWEDITYTFADYKGIYAPEGLNEIMNNMSLYQCAEYYVNILGAKGTPEQVSKELSDFAAEEYRLRLPQKPNAKQFLSYLRERGKHVALATASDISTLKPCFERLGMYEFIEYFASCDTVGKSKEHPDVFLDCAEHFGLSADRCVVIEDAPYAAETAGKAGFSVIGVYEKCNSQKKLDFLARLSEVFIRDFSELM